MRERKQSALALAIGLSLVLAGPRLLSAQELLTNGDFETGAFAPWVATDLGSGAFSIDAPGTTTPVAGFPTAPNAGGGAWYAVTDQGGAGTHAITQSFTVPGPGMVVVSFDMFRNNQAGVNIEDPIGLDHTGPPNQHSRVDILTAAATPFDTGAGVQIPLIIGSDGGPTPNAYANYVFPVALAPGTYQIRFGEVDNQLFYNLGVDNVSVLFTPAAPTMNQWALAVLTGLLLVGGLWWSWKRRALTVR